MTKWQREDPLMDGKSVLDQQISMHLWDVNSRNGWNLAPESSWADRWMPWIIAGTCFIAIVVIRVLNL